MDMRSETDLWKDAARPVGFDGMAGIFTPALGTGASAAALFVGPWALEDICARKFFRVMAEDMAVRGVASLRFDLPGTGDSLDPPSCEGGLTLWETAVLRAADEVKRLSGARAVILVGQGLGAALAARVSSRLEGLAGMALLAPVVSGRFYLREIAAMANMVHEHLGLAEEHRQGGVSVAGFTMADEIAAGLKRLDLMALDVAAVPCLVAERAARPSDAELATCLAARGVPVERLDFAGYDALATNPALSRVPFPVARRIAEWVSGIVSVETGHAAAAPLSSDTVLEGDGFRETPVRFGRETPLYGMLCEPTGARRGATVLLLGTAYDRHAGWARATARMARALASRGIASLRFDAANVGDSPPAPSAPEQVLYDPAQERDVSAALDFLLARGMGPVVLAGRCSGAYTGFRSAVADERVSGAVIANPFTFRWQAGRDVDTALVTVPRALADYGQRALRWATVRRLLRGEINVRRALSNVVAVLLRRITTLFVLHGWQITHEGRALREDFRTLARRDVKLTLVYSEHDAGLDYFTGWFGPKGERLHDFPNAQIRLIPDADHNLTPDHARRAYLDEVAAMASGFSESGDNT